MEARARWEGKVVPARHGNAGECSGGQRGGGSLLLRLRRGLLAARRERGRRVAARCWQLPQAQLLGGALGWRREGGAATGVGASSSCACSALMHTARQRWNCPPWRKVSKAAGRAARTRERRRAGLLAAALRAPRRLLHALAQRRQAPRQRVALALQRLRVCEGGGGWQGRCEV